MASITVAERRGFDAPRPAQRRAASRSDPNGGKIRQTSRSRVGLALQREHQAREVGRDVLSGLVEGLEQHVLVQAVGGLHEIGPAIAVVGVGVEPDPLEVLGGGEGIGDRPVHDAPS